MGSHSLPARISIAQKYLKDCLGLKFSAPIQRGAKGNQQRFYQPVEVPELRTKILAAWRQRDEQRRATKLAEAAAMTGTQAINGNCSSDFVSSSDTVNSTGNIYRSIPAVYQNAVYQNAVYQSEVGNQVVEPLQGVATEPNRLDDLVAMLSDAEDSQTFLALIEGYSPETVEDAIALQDSQHRRKELKTWLEAITGATETGLPPISAYREGDEVWFYNSQSEAKWLKGTIEKVGHGFVRCISGFLGALIERSEEIAPGDWVFS
jgi:hypothetical protein